MNTPLYQNEIVLKDGLANALRSIESVGGKLYLTNFRLIFESHSVNFQTGSLAIDLKSITSIEKTWTKFLGIIPVMPNAFDVSVISGEKYSFTTFGRESWIESIENTRK